MRRSAKVREQAALICQVAASTPESSYTYVARKLGLPAFGAATKLAYVAWSHVNHKLRGNMRIAAPLLDAEAESLIRDDFTPPGR